MLPDGRGDDRLSRVASALLALARALDEAHADVDAHHAPSECHGLVARAYAIRALGTARDHGFRSVDEVENAIASRTCTRVVYDLGLRALTGRVEPAQAGQMRRQWRSSLHK